MWISPDCIRYTTDGSEPDANSPLYEGPLEANGTISLRTFDTRGRGSLTTGLIVQIVNSQYKEHKIGGSASHHIFGLLPEKGPGLQFRKVGPDQCCS